VSSNAADRINEYIAKPGDWRTPVMARVRELISEAAPHAVGEWKWNSPTWSQHGHLVSISAFRNHVGVTFFKGAALPDSQGLFNGGLDAKHSRSLLIHAGDSLDEAAFRALVAAAVAYNTHNARGGSTAR
jgi:hypothetical protein